MQHCTKCLRLALLVCCLASVCLACYQLGKQDLVCCAGTETLSIDTDAVTVCSGGTCKGGSVGGTGTGTSADFSFNNIILASGTKIQLTGKRALRFYTLYDIIIDGGVWNLTSPMQNITVQARQFGTNARSKALACDGKTYTTSHLNFLGGFAGGLSAGYASYSTIQHAAEVQRPVRTPGHSRVSNGAFVTNHGSISPPASALQEVPGAAGGSHGGRGGRSRLANSNQVAVLSAAGRTVFAGGGGGGGGLATDRVVSEDGQSLELKGYDDEDFCRPSHGGASGGLLSFQSRYGSIHLGRVVIVADGADAYGPGIPGGGSGGTIYLTVFGTESIVLSKETRIAARGGYSRAEPSDVWPGAKGEDALGGGGKIRFFGRGTYGTGDRVTLKYSPASLSVSSGAHKCPSASTPG